MSLRELQRAFCNVLTDANARLEYLADPAGYLAAYELDERETRALRGVDLQRLNIYARMLVGSRLELGLRAFPNARTLLPANFIERYGPRYSREFPRTVEINKGPLTREFTRIVPFFERLAAEGEIAAPHFLDLVHYDAIRYTLANDSGVHQAVAAFERDALPAVGDVAALPGRVHRAPGAIVKAFTHNLTNLSDERTESDAAARGSTTVTRESTPSLMLFHKESRSRYVKVFRINALTNAFLERCDGAYSLQDTAWLVAEARRTSLADCVKLAGALATRRVIGILPDPDSTPCAASSAS
jgi:hypothetical protein